MELSLIFVMFVDRLVTPYSTLEFRLCYRKSIRSNLVLGQTTIDLYSLLKQHNGKCKHCLLQYNRVRMIHKKRLDLFANFMLPGQAESVSGPVVMNTDETCYVSCSNWCN